MLVSNTFIVCFFFSLEKFPLSPVVPSFVRVGTIVKMEFIFFFTLFFRTDVKHDSFIASCFHEKKKKTFFLFRCII